MAALAALVTLKSPSVCWPFHTGGVTEYQFGDTTGRMHREQFFWHFASRDFRIQPMVRIFDDYSSLHVLNDIPLYRYPLSGGGKSAVSQGGMLGASPREGLITGVPLTIDPFPDYRLAGRQTTCACSCRG